jgi:hypothetical protein
MLVIEVHTAEPLALGTSSLDVETVIAKFNKFKSPGSDQIPAELIQARGEAIVYEIHKLINSIGNREKFSGQWKQPIIVLI